MAVLSASLDRRQLPRRRAPQPAPRAVPDGDHPASRRLQQRPRPPTAPLRDDEAVLPTVRRRALLPARNTRTVRQRGHADQPARDRPRTLQPRLLDQRPPRPRRDRAHLRRHRILARDIKPQRPAPPPGSLRPAPRQPMGSPAMASGTRNPRLGTDVPTP